MTGGILQLVARGFDDLYILNDPEITYFKIVYRRHTNFSMFPKKLKFNQTLNFGTVGTCQIPEIADLLHRLYLTVEIPEVGPSNLNFHRYTNQELVELLNGYGISVELEGSGDEYINKYTLEEIYDIILTYINNTQIDITSYESIIEDLDIAYSDVSSDSETKARDMFNIFMTAIIENDPSGVPYLDIFEYILNYKDAYSIDTTQQINNFDEIQTNIYSSMLDNILSDSTITDTNLIENIKLYHFLDLENYYFNNSMATHKIKPFFLTILDKNFNLLETSPTYQNLDGYAIMNDYFDFNKQKQIVSEGNLLNFRNNILTNIEWNIKKNYQQLSNLYNLFENAVYNNTNKFNIGFIKLFNQSGSEFFSSDQVSLIKSNNTQLHDYFTNIIKCPNLIGEPITVNHFWGDYLEQTIENFKVGLKKSFNLNGEYFKYLSDYKIINKIQYDTTRYAYLADHDGEIALLNYLPYMIVNDIASYVYEKVQEYDISNSTSYGSSFDPSSSEINSFIQEIINDISDNFDASNNNWDNYLSEIENIYDISNNQQRVFMMFFTPEKILNIPEKSVLEDPSKNYYFDVSLIETNFDIDYSNNYLDPSFNTILFRLTPIEYVLQTSRLFFEKLLEDNIGVSGDLINLKEIVLTKIIDTYKIENLPDYNSYVYNNYSFYEIENSDGTSFSVTEPQHLDALSTILYNIQRNMITKYDTFIKEDVFKDTFTDKYALLQDELDFLKDEIQENFDVSYSNYDFYRYENSLFDISDVINHPDIKYSEFVTLINFYKSKRKILNMRSLDKQPKPRTQFLSYQDIFDYFEDFLVAEQSNSSSKFYINNVSYVNNVFTAINNDISDNLGFMDVVFDISNAVYQDYSDNTGFLDGYNIIFSNNFNYDPSGFHDSVIYLDKTNYVRYNCYATIQDIINYMTDKVVIASGNYKYVEFLSLDIEKTYNKIKNFIQEKIDKKKENLEKIATHDSLGYWRIPEKDTIIIDSSEEYKNNTYDTNNPELFQKLQQAFTFVQPSFAWAPELFHRLIEKITLEIGGVVFDELDDRLLKTNAEIYNNGSKIDGYNKMIGNTPELNTYNSSPKPKTMLYLRLPFWFCKHVSCSLPMVAMHNSEINIRVKLKALEEVARWTSYAEFKRPLKINCQMIGEFIYVDADERKQLCEKKLEYLTENYQHVRERIITADDLSNKKSFEIKMQFKNPTKLIWWILEPYEKNTEWNNFSFGDYRPIETLKLKFNGRDRETEKGFGFYEWVQPYNKFCGSMSENVGLYSFGIYPLQLQPSGTASMSYLAETSITFYPTETLIDKMINENVKLRVRAYSLSYNILRIMSGMAGFAFYG